MKFFLNLVNAYHLNCKLSNLESDNIKGYIKSLKNIFSKSSISLIENEILLNFNKNLTFKSRDLDLKVFNNKNEILNIKIVRNIDKFVIHYKYFQNVYSKDQDIKNLLLSLELVKFIEQNKNTYTSQIYQNYLDTSKKLQKIYIHQQNVNKSFEEKLEKMTSAFRNFINFYFSQYPNTIHFQRILSIKQENEIGSLDIWPYTLSLTNPDPNNPDKKFQINKDEVLNNEHAFELLTKIEDSKTNRWYYLKEKSFERG